MVAGGMGKGKLVWSAQFHHLFPRRFKDIVRTLMLMRSRQDCVWAMLPMELVFVIVHGVADEFPGTTGTFPTCCVRAPSKGLVAARQCGPNPFDIAIAFPGVYPGQVQFFSAQTTGAGHSSDAIEAHSRRIRCLALSRDGSKLATASSRVLSKKHHHKCPPDFVSVSPSLFPSVAYILSSRLTLLHSQRTLSFDYGIPVR